MYVKRLQQEQILDALHLAWEVFAEDVAPTYPPEGVAEFQQFIKYEYMLPKVQSGEVCFFGAIEGDELCGMSAIKQDGHVILLFVKKNWQKKGAARMLFYAMQQYLVIERAVVQMTVSATPNAVEAYKHLGFRPTNSEQIVDGVRFVPMAYVIVDAANIATGGGRTGTKRVGLLLVLLVIGFLGMSIFGGKAAAELIESFKEEYISEEKERVSEEQKDTDDQEGTTEKETGIYVINSYMADNLSYTVKDEVYTYYSDGKKGEYPMEFEVHYPQLEGADYEFLDEINEELKACAMSTVNVLYLHPSQSTKEAMLKQKNPILTSQVTYNITYASDEFISVVFNDFYYAGSQNNGYVDLRTRNINLKEGMYYHTNDIVDLSDEFVREWKIRMKEEAPQAQVMDELKTSECYQILDGTVLNGNYYEVFFVDADGVQIGMTYHHTSENGTSVGWITAPFRYDEIEEYAKEGEFWSLIK